MIKKDILSIFGPVLMRFNAFSALALLVMTAHAWTLMPAPIASAMAATSTNTPGISKEDLARRIEKTDAQVSKLPQTLSQSPGMAIGIFHKGEKVFELSAGLALLDHQIPMTADTIMSVGSVSKQFTAFAIQLLVSDGKLDVNDDARAILPYLKNAPQPILIRHLLHHQSGLKDVWGYFPLLDMDEGQDITPELLQYILSLHKTLSFEPGTHYSYNNTGYAVLADVVAAVSGMDFPTFLETRVFKPLGMRDTLARGQAGQFIERSGRPYAPISFAKDLNDPQNWSEMSLNYTIQGASNIYTTINDLGRWSSNLISPIAEHSDAVSAMSVTGTLNDGTVTSYASGLYKSSEGDLDVLQHGGFDRGFAASIVISPQHEIAVVGMANTLHPSAPVYAVIDEIAAMLLSDASDDTGADDPSPLPYTEEQSTFLGSYVDDNSGLAFEIIVEDDALWLKEAALDTNKVQQGGMSQLIRVTENSFRGENFMAEFLEGAGSSETRIILRQDGGPTLTFTRASTDESSEEETKERLGTYYCAELDHDINIVRSQNGIALSVGDDFASHRLTPLSPSHFNFAIGRTPHHLEWTFVAPYTLTFETADTITISSRPADAEFYKVRCSK